MKNNIIYFQDYIETNTDVQLTSVDNYSLTHFDKSPRLNTDQSVMDLPAGSWLKFNTIIPDGMFANCMLFASTQTSNQKIQIFRDSLESEPLWTLTAKASGVDKFFTESVSNNINCDTTEPADIYILFPDGFTGYLNWFVFSQYSGTETEEAKLRRMKWFDDSRFGHMMHWGAYSVLGEGEWVMNTNQIPKSDYITEACAPFNPDKYSPDEWAYIIQSTGQKYLTITTKHHDGFAMFDTNVTEFAPYDVENTAAIHQSVLRPLATACRERGIIFCCYYSLLDWGNVNEVAIEDDAAVPTTINPADVTRYLSEMKEHLKELIEIFDPALIWFDGAWAAFLNKDVSTNIRDFLHRLSPDIIINDRIGNGAGDYSTPEQSIPTDSQTGPWEACMTINNSWGYNTSDTNWKDAQVLLNDLLDCASKGGNLLLNTGPDAEGVIPQPCVDRLSEIGRWMQTWGEAIYETRAGTLNVSMQPSVFCTLSKTKKLQKEKLYVTITNLPEDKKLRVGQPITLPSKVYWLTTPQTLLDFEILSGCMLFTLPDSLSDPLGMVLVMEFEEIPQPKIYPDVAIFSHAEASNVWYGDNEDYSPQNMVDNDPQTRWAADQANNVTLTLTFAMPTSIDLIGFNQYEQRIADFSIDIYSATELVTTLKGNNPARNYLASLPMLVSADKIVLTIHSCIDSTKPASLYTFSAFNSTSSLLPVIQPVNLAKGAVTAASDVWYDERTEYKAAFATDGNPNTRWAANDNTELPVTFTITFLKDEFFDRISVKEFLNADELSRIKNFTLQILDDTGVDWKNVYQSNDISKGIVLPYLTRSKAIRFEITELVSNKGPSFYEVGVYQTARTPVTLTEEELLEAEARLCFEYFWKEANITDGSAGYGLISDMANSRRSTIAGSGFAFSAFVIAVERGWISKAEAENRLIKSLQTLKNPALRYKGFYYHFINMDSLDTLDSEVSTVDTMLALNGILTAGQYFGETVGALAQQIFDDVEWDAAVAPNGHFTMGWDSNLVQLSATWGGYAEQFCMYPMATGSTTHAPTNAADMFYKLERKYGHYGNSGDLIYVWGGQLFTYQFSHAWLDFRRLWDKKGADWWQNSINASKANREFCIANHDVLPSLDADNWGLTACNGPNGYAAYGAPPSGDIGANNMHFTDGTVTPSGPIGSLPFMPQEVLQAMMKWFNNPQLWTGYGFSEAFNSSLPASWYCSNNSALIKGLSLIMIENYRSGLIWDTYMKHPVVAAGNQQIFGQQEPELLVQESSDSIIYTGSGWWLADGRPDSSDGKSQVTQNNGDYFEFTFNGRNASVYCEKNSDQGDIDFYLDDVFVGTTSTWSESLEFSDIIYSVNNLSPDTHILKGVKRSGKWLTVDAMKVYASNSFDVIKSTFDATTNSLNIQVSQATDRTSAMNIKSYTINQPASISNIALSSDKKTITLTLTGISSNIGYVITTQGVMNEIVSEKLNKRNINIIG
ncbi:MULTISPECIES: alpha-L-fucosidase [Citrobacter]|uniref:alpha-L-fucosidase n=1 Tax=Citrobacter TaxID=544 RepID=UPI001122C6A2|nr:MULTISPECIES: alpha-L-fucosidase [Citrobacter]EKX2181744.1 alpha-L-fucosidase [Citrobacter freundii]MBA7997650.1 alpha-L-fucosidase [Citrobacter freundii]MBJ8965555.1 alpha-L-fucosidase [Citrobacter freundii]MDV1634475.1 alpha-L-fucosidase [Citrobacter freundii]MDV1713832.1 alpha-L-fucosidase [Citrobacter freundii]